MTNVLKGVYLCCYKAEHKKYNLDYNDVINLPHINLCCSCLDVDLSHYDYILASPPCNYWSRANYRRDISFV